MMLKLDVIQMTSTGRPAPRCNRQWPALEHLHLGAIHSDMHQHTCTLMQSTVTCTSIPAPRCNPQWHAPAHLHLDAILSDMHHAPASQIRAESSSFKDSGNIWMHPQRRASQQTYLHTANWLQDSWGVNDDEILICSQKYKLKTHLHIVNTYIMLPAILCMQLAQGCYMTEMVLVSPRIKPRTSGCEIITFHYVIMSDIEVEWSAHLKPCDRLAPSHAINRFQALWSTDTKICDRQAISKVK